MNVAIMQNERDVVTGAGSGVFERGTSMSDVVARVAPLGEKELMKSSLGHPPIALLFESSGKYLAVP